ncbi:NifU homolog involved in Fe-S cluster formation [Novosphingobium sp. B1]|nr:NifU homolog involved in Fe-S cluster formation [Novosphingobium sp. B1]
MSSRGLYTPQILAKAMELSALPFDDGAPLKGSARSRSCGSVIELSLASDEHGAITAIGIRPHACAIGQAAAAIFANAAPGMGGQAISQARVAIAAWLSGEGDIPQWPEMQLLEQARSYPARHGAILLAWDAALEALG